MKLKRKIDETLLRWKEESDTALFLLGARQTGKTFAIRSLGAKFENFIDINFVDNPELVDGFARIKNPRDLIIRISSIPGNGAKMKAGKTLIFLDEIQAVYLRRKELKLTSPSFVSLDLVTAMKRLSEERKYRFALSGSLLGVLLNDIDSYPAGYLEERHMYPLDFEEYLWALGIGDDSISYLKACFANKELVDESLNRHFLDLFREYVLVGGMPRPVSRFLEKENLYLVDVDQRDIVTAYKKDVTTYVNDEGKKLRIRDMYDAMPSELNQKNKRFVFSHVFDVNYLKANDPIDLYLWLKAAGIAIPTYNVTEPKIPLSISSERKTLKLFLNDVGLLCHSLFSTGIKDKLLNGEEVINFGAPYENVAAQELYAHGFDEGLYYYNSKKNGEVDFLIQNEEGVLPIEIKSGKLKESTYYNHSALNKLVSLYGIKNAYVFGQGNVKREDEVITEFPIYMIDFVSCFD